MPDAREARLSFAIVSFMLEIAGYLFYLSFDDKVMNPGTHDYVCCPI